MQVCIYRTYVKTYFIKTIITNFKSKQCHTLNFHSIYTYLYFHSKKKGKSQVWEYIPNLQEVSLLNKKGVQPTSNDSGSVQHSTASPCLTVIIGTEISITK
uniref:Uncharacterized protein n=1 Tax=Micrurus lemniscatus lemniscatus TaxID=129467 RepID=A0A2D4IV79_MICLE